ncbi:Panacea domain-containing protein [Spiroplasma endosymbiont of Aspidapion aeneum]|uniref:Panacea domain-containing protein n=1 Tax=Spiroplasma endosymbiont of Aspidapion aeneum TaxID=3066276 RepID=UPI00313A8309
MLSKEKYIKLILNELAYNREKNKHPLTQLTIHKVIYLVYAYFLAKNIELADIEFEAWLYGPVIRELWEKYKSFGSSNINIIYIKELDASYDNLDKNIMNTIKKICFLLTKMEIFEIVNVIHEQSPWKLIFKPMQNKKITKKDIINYYKKYDSEIIIYLDNFIMN